MEERLTTDQAVAGSSPATDVFVPQRQRNTPGGTRTHNLWLREPTPYPLGYRGYCEILSVWGCSSNGRALAQHARGTGIDTLHLHSLQTRSRQDSNLRGQSPVDFWSTPLTAWVRLLTHSAKCDEGGVRTHASEEIAALTQRLRPLGHLATATPCGTRTRNLWIRSPTR